MVTFKEMCDVIQKQDEKLEFVNVLRLHEFVTEEKVTSKGKYKVTLTFDAKEMLKNPQSLPRTGGDFIYRPFLLVLKYKPKP